MVLTAAMEPKKSGFVFACLLFFQNMLSLIDASQDFSDRKIVRDVCIIGGGSGGTYSAIRLQQLGRSVALIEKENRLGGHVNTYVDKSTNKTFDYGVEVFDNTSLVRDYFAHLNVPLAAPDSPPGNSINVNFETGKVAPGPNSSEADLVAALEAYKKQLAQYPYLVTGWQDLPESLPEDFLLKWGDYIQKYQLGGLAYLASNYCQGFGNSLAQLTLYIFKYFSISVVQGILNNSFVTTARHNNQELYDNALAELDSNAFLSSNVTKITRSDNTVEVTISTPSGVQRIQASKLLVAIPPKLSNLSPFLDLDDQESSIFGQFNNSYYWDALVKNSGIPDNTTLNNVNPALPYDIPANPGIYGVGATGDGNIHSVYYGSPYHLSDEAVQTDILATSSRLAASLGYSNGTAELVGFHYHAPYELTVSADAIKDGFYHNLTALQGYRNTWWTGATWQAHDSSNIWNYTEYEVLPKITD